MNHCYSLAWSSLLCCVEAALPGSNERFSNMVSSSCAGSATGGWLVRLWWWFGGFVSCITPPSAPPGCILIESAERLCSYKQGDIKYYSCLNYVFDWEFAFVDTYLSTYFTRSNQAVTQYSAKRLPLTLFVPFGNDLDPWVKPNY